jgi:hypothetical protein
MKPTPRQRIKLLQLRIAQIRKDMERIESDGGFLGHNDPLIVNWTLARRELRKLQGNSL